MVCQVEQGCDGIWVPRAQLNLFDSDIRLKVEQLLSVTGSRFLLLGI
jgi:hypothetical protein